MILLRVVCFSSIASIFFAVLATATDDSRSLHSVKVETTNNTSSIKVAHDTRRNNNLRKLEGKQHRYRHEYSPEWKSLCTEESQISSTLPNNLETLEDLQDFILGKNHGDKPFVPHVYDATESFLGARIFNYNGFVIRPIFFESLPFTFKNNQDHPKCTLVFGWLSLPISTTDQKVPGVILLHGGGSTADRRWNERWAREGFASLSIGLEGQTSDRTGEPIGLERKRYLLTPAPGPRRTFKVYGDYKLPLKDQWMFHAMASAMLATTILQSDSSVVPSQVGVAGCSWGGVLAATLLPLEHTRYAFASIGYGTANLATDGRAEASGTTIRNNNSSSEKVGSETYLGVELWEDYPTKLDSYETFWNPAASSSTPHSFSLSQAQTPTLWVSSPKERHFSIMAQRTTIDALHKHSPVWISNVFNLPHSQQLLYERPEHYFFAKMILKQQNQQQSSSLKHLHQHYPYDPLKLQMPGGIGRDYVFTKDSSSLDRTKYYSMTFRLSKPLLKVSLVYTFDQPYLTKQKPVKSRTWHEHVVSLPSKEFEQLLSFPDHTQGSNMIDYHSLTNSTTETPPLLEFQHSVRMRQITCKREQEISDTKQQEQQSHDGKRNDDDHYFCFWSIVVALPPNLQAWYINAHMYNMEAHRHYQQTLRTRPKEKWRYMNVMSGTLDYIVSGPYHEIQEYYNDRNVTSIAASLSSPTNKDIIP